MDKENVFDNESIWILEQIMEPLYTVSPNGKGVVPYLAKSYTLSADKKTYTFHLRPGVKFSNGKLMTSADVKFSIDQTRKAGPGLGLPRRRDQGHHDARSRDGGHPDQVPVGAVPGRHRPVRERHRPQQLRRARRRRSSTPTPIGTGPFMWGHWTHGVEIVLKRNPHYWQKGKPYLDQVTWKTVTDTNTRELQLEGGQAQIDEFPDWQTVNTLENTPASP